MCLRGFARGSYAHMFDRAHIYRLDVNATPEGVYFCWRTPTLKSVFTTTFECEFIKALCATVSGVAGFVVRVHNRWSDLLNSNKMGDEFFGVTSLKRRPRHSLNGRQLFMYFPRLAIWISSVATNHTFKCVVVVFVRIQVALTHRTPWNYAGGWNKVTNTRMH